ncbi:MAG: DUF4352 domain-containing protein [Thomasclavelia sp.]|jgi:uncharacterized protein YcfL|nr:DUF4352 domain-containing protein [Thomasclavelia sp.]
MMKKIFSIFLVMIMCVGLVGCSSSSDDESSDSKKKTKTEFGLNETGTLDKVNYTVTNFQQSQGEEYFTPDEGNTYYVVTVKIENKSDEKIDFNSLYWKILDSNGVEKTDVTLYDTGHLLDSGDLNAGGTVEGDLVYELPSGSTGLKVRVYPDVLDNKTCLTFDLN